MCSENIHLINISQWSGKKIFLRGGKRWQCFLLIPNNYYCNLTRIDCILSSNNKMIYLFRFQTFKLENLVQIIKITSIFI